MANEDITIEDNLYSDKSEETDVLQETKSQLDEIDNQFTEKVIKITIKGQIDGN